MNSSPPPAEDLSTALERLAARGPSGARAEGVATAVAAYAAEAPRAVRLYRLSEVAVVLASFATTLLLLDSQGLVTWARRMDVGPVQAGWLATLAPLHSALERTGLTVPRVQLEQAGERLTRALGAGADPVLEAGWSELAPEPISAAELEPTPSEQPAVIERDAPVPAPVAEGVGVLLLGDSMLAGSLGGTLERALTRDSRLRVGEAFQTATGLSRPEAFSWMRVVPGLLARDQPRLIVVSLGANDATNLLEAGSELGWGETGWRDAYRRRVVAMMRKLTSGGAWVLWLGLPPMRDAHFSERMQVLNAISAQAAASVPGVEFLDVKMLVSDEHGEYATFLRSPDGRFVRFRNDDGIHYAPAASRAITRWVVDWIYERYRKLPH